MDIIEFGIAVIWCMYGKILTAQLKKCKLDLHEKI